jgi:hypothetical protein
VAGVASDVKAMKVLSAANSSYHSGRFLLLSLWKVETATQAAFLLYQEHLLLPLETRKSNIYCKVTPKKRGIQTLQCERELIVQFLKVGSGN